MLCWCSSLFLMPDEEKWYRTLNIYDNLYEKHEIRTKIAPRIYWASPSLFHMLAEEKWYWALNIYVNLYDFLISYVVGGITFPHAWWGKVISNAKYIWQSMKYHENTTSYIFSVVTFPNPLHAKVWSNAKYIRKRRKYRFSVSWLFRTP